MLSFDVGNLNLGSSNIPKGIIQFNPSVKGKQVVGVRITSRRVPSNSTLTGFRVDRRLIIAPGTSVLFFLTSETLVKGELIFQWFESEDIFC